MEYAIRLCNVLKIKIHKCLDDKKIYFNYIINKAHLFKKNIVLLLGSNSQKWNTFFSELNWKIVGQITNVSFEMIRIFNLCALIKIMEIIGSLSNVRWLEIEAHKYTQSNTIEFDFEGHGFRKPDEIEEVQLNF